MEVVHRRNTYGGMYVAARSKSTPATARRTRRNQRMKSNCRWFGLAAVVFGLTIGATGQSRADTVLLNLINPPVQSDTPYNLSFVTTGTSTTVSIGGYQLPSYEQSTDNGLYLGGTGPNLLGTTWGFIPAASGTLANQYDDGSPVNGLNFGGTSEGYYDTFYQTIATTVGASYTLSFLFTEDEPGPSGFMVTASGALSSVPEPSSLVLAGSGVLAVFVLARRRKATAAA
jgi:PEP-CTERM motif